MNVRERPSASLRGYPCELNQVGGIRPTRFQTTDISTDAGQRADAMEGSLIDVKYSSRVVAIQLSMPVA